MDTEYKRLNRLTLITNMLQAKRLVTASALAEKFGVSIRTIYRDIRTLEQSGIPIVTEEGKGYSLVDGYRLPPVSFTETEALALITAEQLVKQSTDTSLIRAFEEAILKIKSVLTNNNKSMVERLSGKVVVGKNFEKLRKSHQLIEVQQALIQYKLMEVDYTKENGESSRRIIEPFLLYNNASDEWTLIAYCRLRADFRAFRLDRMTRITFLDVHFEPHTLTVAQYLKKYVKHP